MASTFSLVISPWIAWSRVSLTFSLYHRFNPPFLMIRLLLNLGKLRLYKPVFTIFTPVNYINGIIFGIQKYKEIVADKLHLVNGLRSVSWV